MWSMNLFRKTTPRKAASGPLLSLQPKPFGERRYLLRVSVARSSADSPQCITTFIPPVSIAAYRYNLRHRSSKSIDLDDLWRRLYLYAAMLTGGMNVVMHCGLSAEDLATETLNKYLLSPNGLGWRESKGPLAAFLGVVLRNKFIDHIRRQKEVSRTKPESDETPHPTATAETPDDDLAFQEFRDGLLT